MPTPERAGELDDEGFIVPATTRREWDFSRDGILRSVDSSLDGSGWTTSTSCICTIPTTTGRRRRRPASMRLIELREQGVTRAIGAGMNQSAMLTEFVRRCDIDVVMLAGRYTLLDQSALDDLLPLALKRGVGVVAAGVYNSGLLARAQVPDDAQFEYATAPPRLVARAREIAELCAGYGVTLPDVALQFPLRHPAVVSAVVGTRSGAESMSSLERYATPIPDDLWNELESAGFIRALTVCGVR